MTSSRCRLRRTIGAAAGSTRYVSRARGYARRSAPINGVVNTTSPIRRSRISRMRSGLDGGLVNQHHGNIVFDRIDAPALRALEGGAPLDQLDLRFAVGARQDLEQLRINHETAPRGLL